MLCTLSADITVIDSLQTRLLVCHFLLDCTQEKCVCVCVCVCAELKKEQEEGDEPRAETESESEEELSCFAPTVSVLIQGG